MNETKQATIAIVAGVLSTFTGEPSKMHPERVVGMATRVTNVVAEALLTREWRCWREDGSYYGPCTPEQLLLWDETPCVHGEVGPHPYPEDEAGPTNEHLVVLRPNCPGGGWSHRHQDCGWQHYIMASDLYPEDEMNTESANNL